MAAQGECSLCGSEQCSGSALSGNWPEDIHGALWCESCRYEFRQTARSLDPGEGVVAVNTIAIFATRIRSRRAAQAEPVVKDADGFPLVVGDRAVTNSGVRGRVTRIEQQKMSDGDFRTLFFLDTDGGRRDHSAWSNQLRKLPAPQHQAEASGDVGLGQKAECEDCWGHYSDTCPGCGLTKESLEAHNLIPADIALAEVERQAALVARLDRDMCLLSLLRVGYQTGDLLALMAEKARGK